MKYKNLWAITSYFNPCGWKRRAHNFRIFRERLDVPLVVVELGFLDEFELRTGQAEILIQTHGSAAMFQKERLLNLALQHIPDDCDAVAWLDCDVIFERADWAQVTCAALEKFPILQLYQWRHDLPRDILPEELTTLESCRTFQSIGSRIGVEPVPDDLLHSAAHLKTGFTSGLAWAARREVLDGHGFYDTCIIGGGDKAYICAAIGRFDCLIKSQFMGSSRSDHYLKWARPLNSVVRGNVGSIEGAIFHLWHGDLANRQTQVRHSELSEFDFDPYYDLALDHGGSWRWNSDKPGLHQHVFDFLLRRAEDG